MNTFLITKLSTVGRVAMVLGVIQASLVCNPSESHGLFLRYFWNNSGGDFEFTNPNNWGAENGEPGGVGRLPGHWLDVGDDLTHSSDSPTNDTTNAIHQASGTINLNSNFTPANPFDIFIIRGGTSSLNISADLNLAGIPLLHGQSAGATNTITHATGAVSASTLILGDKGGDAVTAYNMFDGSLSLSGNLSIANDSGVPSTLSIQGDTAMVSVGGNLSLSGTVAGGSAAGDPTLDFILGATGINTIDVTGSFDVDSANSLLNIDLSALTSPWSSITLVDADSMTGSFLPGNVTVTGFDIPGADWILTQNAGGSGDLVLSVVPEPSTFLLLLIGLVGLRACRHRRRK